MTEPQRIWWGAIHFFSRRTHIVVFASSQPTVTRPDAAVQVVPARSFPQLDWDQERTFFHKSMIRDITCQMLVGMNKYQSNWVPWDQLRHHAKFDVLPGLQHITAFTDTKSVLFHLICPKGAGWHILSLTQLYRFDAIWHLCSEPCT